MAKGVWKVSLACLLAASWFLSPMVVGAGPPLPSTTVAQAGELAAVDRIVASTNAVRSQVGAPPVREIVYLHKAAEGHSREMLELDFFSHTSPTPGREKTKNRVQLADGWDTKVGENIYRSTGVKLDALADRVMTAWQKSPTHYKILTSPEFNSIGVGIVAKGNEFAITQVFSYQAIAVEEMVAVPTGGGYSLTFEGVVRDGARQGGLFVNNTFKESFQADGSGRFQVRASVPSGAAVSVSQKKGENKYAQSLAFPIEAARK